MDFVNLDRMFAPLVKDKEATLEWGVAAGRKYGGWQNWDELLQRPRVVLLAEALSGKTQELLFQTKKLKNQSKHAYFVRIEELADNGFEASLDETDTVDFREWKPTSEPAWFFLDSVDEARLNKKNFDLALRRFSKELGRENLGRAHVLVTCRASDWHGKGDRDLIADRLPHVVLPSASAMLDPDEELLAPIFRPTENAAHRESLQRPKEVPAELLVVQLVPLTFEQKRSFANAAGISNPDEFLREADRSGLLRMTERPGDLIDLVGYWKEHLTFGTLREMTEEGIRRKLTEEDAYRPDAGEITPQQAREGAERLAAALVLGKSFTLRAIGQESEPELSYGAIEPLKVLPDWTPAQIGALLRRGLFAPATYGRVRFHQRTSQEYLTASWLKRLLGENCPLDEVTRLLFVELYGVETIRPALRAVTAWLAYSHPIILDEAIRREPVCLIAHGDPRSLPIPVRARLLQAYAELDAKGELNAEMIDHRAAWMFSDPELAEAIHDAWNSNARNDFRLQLLRFIEEGPIPGCIDLARQVSLDQSQNVYCRTIAARALRACSDGVGLGLLARDVRAAPDKLNARLAPEFGAILYPSHLTTADLLDLIARSQPARRFQSEGFGPRLADLFRASSDIASARQFAFGVAELCLERSPGEDTDSSSEDEHAELGSGLAEVAQLELASRRHEDVEPGVVRLLMAIERVMDHHSSDVLIQLTDRVRSDAKLNRDLMWANANIGIRGRPRDNPPIYFWQIGPFYGTQLWGIGESDLQWLMEDARMRPHESERRVAFSAVYHVLHNAKRLPAERFRLEDIAGGNPCLLHDLAHFETPPPTDGNAKRLEKAKLTRKQQEESDKQSWRDFREELKKHPEFLDSPANLISWQAGLYRLHHLTKWIQAKTGNNSPESSRSWRVLRPVFGNNVAEHYKNGMCLAWRQIKAERPVYHGNGSFSTKFTSTLALHGLAIESVEVSDWAKNLSSEEVRLAVKHCCYVGDCSTDWFQHLVGTRMNDAANVIQTSVEFEYASEGVRSDLLVGSANGPTTLRNLVASRVFRLLRKSEPTDETTLERALHILAVSRNEMPAKALRLLVETRLDAHLNALDDKRALVYYALYLLLAPDDAAHQLCGLMARNEQENETAWQGRLHKWLGHLFGRGYRDGSGTLTQLSASSLLALLKLLYGSRLPRPDERGGARTRTVRDAADDAQSAALNALVARPGTEAFQALLQLATDPTFGGDRLRILELAHGKAESDGDLVAWSESDVLDFERAGTGPAKTGSDLLRVVTAVLSDIATSFAQSDASSRSILELAQDEYQVQTWLAERLNERSRGRFHAHREPKVARGNEPDIVVSSTSANVEVAIEVKNGNKGWTVTQLENTLSGQLARDYLRTHKRRHGILVVSLHSAKTWRRNGLIWNFSNLMDHLQSIAAGVICNETGPVEVRAFALDARARTDQTLSIAARKTAKKSNERPPKTVRTPNKARNFPSTENPT